ncbi:hypothetical protein [Vogesella mureinivorans]|nr:hypothetical protein [Vogesella mureinivorans]
MAALKRKRLAAVVCGQPFLLAGKIVFVLAECLAKPGSATGL